MYHKMIIWIGWLFVALIVWCPYCRSVGLGMSLYGRMRCFRGDRLNGFDWWMGFIFSFLKKQMLS